MKRVAEGSFENISYKVFRDAENNEFVTKYYVDGKKYEDGDYFTSDKQDAINTGESEIRFMYERLNDEPKQVCDMTTSERAVYFMSPQDKEAVLSTSNVYCTIETYGSGCDIYTRLHFHDKKRGDFSQWFESFKSETLKKEIEKSAA